jgi:ABC-2 type transport system ATP-binding protein
MPHDSTRAKARTGFMAEHPGFYNHLSGEELLQFYADLVGLSHKESGKRITELLSMVGLSKKGNQKIKTYSKGMLQRIALAQALINRPELLILDEPMSGLDPIGRRDFRDIMLDLAEYGVTIFFSSHILPDVESICDRVAILIDGTVQAEGEIDDIVSLEVDQFDLYFSGISIPQLKTPLLGSHKGPDSNWARVSAQNKDALMKEIIDAKAKLLRVNPVRSSLEEILIGKYREAKS